MAIPIMSYHGSKGYHGIPREFPRGPWDPTVTLGKPSEPVASGSFTIALRNGVGHGKLRGRLRTATESQEKLFASGPVRCRGMLHKIPGGPMGSHDIPREAIGAEGKP